MGSHNWTVECPECGFEEALSSSFNELLELICPICGYKRWVEQRTPSPDDVQLAKRCVSEMSYKEKMDAVESFNETGLPLIVRLKEKKE